jgi:Mg2+/citrate symporter
MKKKEILDLLFWVFLVIAIILFVWLLVGSTPSIDLIVISILAGLIVRFYSSIEDIREKLGDHSRHLRNLNERVEKIEKKMKVK